jgi:hypothetical protein
MQETNKSNFVQPTEPEVYKYAKFTEGSKVQKWILSSLLQKIYSQGFYRNLFLSFMSFIAFSMYFRSLYEFLQL